MCHILHGASSVQCYSHTFIFYNNGSLFWGNTSDGFCFCNFKAAVGKTLKEDFKGYVYIYKTHHSQVVIHGLEGAAEQLAGLWISDLSDAPSILRVPDAKSPIQGCGHNDVIAQRPSKVCDGTSMTFQSYLHTRRRRGQCHDGQGAIQWAAGEEVLVVIGKLQPRNLNKRRKRHFEIKVYT